MNTDAFAIATAQAAIRTALVGLDVAYKACTDCRVEDTLVSLTDQLNEYLGDLDNLADQIEGDRKSWNRRYEAA